MISHQYKCIFIHIPKCAGTSIEKVLGHYTLYDGRRKQDHRSLRMIERPVPYIKLLDSDNFIDYLRTIKYYFKPQLNPYNKFNLKKDQYSTYYKFTFVRNPWDRAFSWYKNVMRDEVHSKDLGLVNNISFEDFLKGNIGVRALRPQTYWIKDYNGNINMDFIGKFENLQNDFNVVAETLNLTQFQLPHELKSDNKSYKEFYSDKTKDIVWDFYKEEIKLFDYEF